MPKDFLSSPGDILFSLSILSNLLELKRSDSSVLQTVSATPFYLWLKIGKIKPVELINTSRTKLSSQPVELLSSQYCIFITLNKVV